MRNSKEDYSLPEPREGEIVGPELASWVLVVEIVALIFSLSAVSWFVLLAMRQLPK